jgi:hypothetical protein
MRSVRRAWCTWKGWHFRCLPRRPSRDLETANGTRARAKKLLLQAQAAGDNNNLVQVLLEKLDQSAEAGPAPPTPLGHEWVEKGEAAFTRGDLPGAVDFYKKAFDG